ncbi:PAAR-like domain-containing protein [Puniceibacterium sp. IMCC21224]|uniref:PAAR-like domain-containing protein n=1 Tax=Puniceibacterium sp. IMCC21224 TaxID=1618204 RepID=UPI00065D76C2|nr:PAAR-like domain-containing protein [Puniceibacterium sp. IMCC21224]KMK65247.1 GHH signature containing HNH/Endo VII superfamily nuclease toxin 2/Domain of unknown function (DUF4150) [Puniceibacterium sp. IMCC21224]
MTVFANMLEVACKAQTNQVIAAMPDVCFTPPEAPPTPPGVPIPYPSFGMDGDTDKGTGTVKIGGENVSHKNKSFFSKTMGTEAGVAAKKGLVTSKNTGKSYNQAWSSNVKAEGQPVSRFSDISTNNHGSIPGNSPPWPKISKPGGVDAPDPCEGDKKKIKDACEGYKDMDEVCKEAGLNKKAGESNVDGSSDRVYKMAGGVLTEVRSKRSKTSTVDTAAGEFRGSSTRDRDFEAAQGPSKRQKTDKQKEQPSCLAALRCKLAPYKKGDKACCGKQTPHHVVPKSSFVDTNDSGKALAGCANYNGNDAPCICAEGASSTKGSHGRMHAFLLLAIHKATSLKGTFKPDTKTLALDKGGSVQGREMSYKQQREAGVASVMKVFPRSKCSAACLAAQLDGYHKDEEVGVKDDTPLRADTIPGRGPEESKNMIAALGT